MIEGNHRVVNENKKHSEFKKDEVICIKRISRKNGIYEAVGKGQYKASFLKGISSLIK